MVGLPSAEENVCNNNGVELPDRAAAVKKKSQKPHRINCRWPRTSNGPVPIVPAALRNHGSGEPRRIIRF